MISFVAFRKYRINGTINPEGLLERVQTWVPNPVVGDMYYENVYTNYREVGGVQIPRFHQHQDYDDGAHAPNVSGGRPCVWSRIGGTVGCVRSREVLMRRLPVITVAAGNGLPLTTNEGDSQVSKEHLLL